MADPAPRPRRRGLNPSFDVLLALGLIMGLVLLFWVTTDVPTPDAEPDGGVSGWLRRIADYVALGAEAAAILIIAVAAVRALLTCTRLLVGRSESMHAVEYIRLRFGRMLVLGLEFSVAADILRTFVHPTWQSAVTLTALVLLRTLISTVLEREIRQVEARRAQRADTDDEAT